MLRRTLLALIGAATTFPMRRARAEAAAHRTIGYLGSASAAGDAGIVRATREGLAAGGFLEGRNIEIVFRWGDGKYDRLPALAADLVSRNVAVIICSGLPATLAAKAATTTIPIVFRLAIDPVAFKLVASMNRPGGNLTGVTVLFDPLTPKKLELLHELVPTAAVIGFLINPKNPNAESHRLHAEVAAKRLGLGLAVLTAGAADDVEAAFAAAKQSGVGALLLGDDPFFATQRAALASAAARNAIPTMYYVRDFVAVGGLISYGPNFAEPARQSGEYVAKILNGASPAELPIAQPTKFDLVINLKTAKTLDLTVPQSLLARADEVIE